MKKFMILYLAPTSVIDDWKKTDPGTRKAAEEKMQADWKKWMGEHGKMFRDMASGGKTKKVDAQGISDTRNEIMLYSIVEAESHDAVAKTFANHPHLGIPKSSIEIMEINSLQGM